MQGFLHCVWSQRMPYPAAKDGEKKVGMPIADPVRGQDAPIKTTDWMPSCCYTCYLVSDLRPARNVRVSLYTSTYFPLFKHPTFTCNTYTKEHFIHGHYIWPSQVPALNHHSPLNFPHYILGMVFIRMRYAYGILQVHKMCFRYCRPSTHT